MWRIRLVTCLTLARGFQAVRAVSTDARPKKNFKSQFEGGQILFSTTISGAEFTALETSSIASITVV